MGIFTYVLKFQVEFPSLTGQLQFDWQEKWMCQRPGSYNLINASLHNGVWQYQKPQVSDGFCMFLHVIQKNFHGSFGDRSEADTCFTRFQASSWAGGMADFVMV